MKHYKIILSKTNETIGCGITMNDSFSEANSVLSGNITKIVEITKEEYDKLQKVLWKDTIPSANKKIKTVKK